MTRLLGVLVTVLALYVFLLVSFEGAASGYNHQVLAKRLGYYGVVTVGVGVLIVAGGIDLSIGALAGLAAVCFGLLLARGVPAVAAAVAALACGAGLGLIHGLLVTRVRLQPFLVTLCGLFMYRGLARYLGGGSVQLVNATESVQPGLRDLRWGLVSGTIFGLPNELLLLFAIAGLVALFLHGTVHGRYLYAIGHNDQAARYAGISTDRYKVLAYVICATLAAFAGVLLLLEVETSNPESTGTLLELYAITGAVLGGCSLRGGEGSVPGMMLGAAVLPLLQQICTKSTWISSELEYTVIGGVLLVCTIINELLARRPAAHGK